MSIKSTGSLAGLAGCVGTLKIGEGLLEFSRQLTRGEEFEQRTDSVNWVLPPLQPSNYWN